jgi:hypothetical protein
VEGPVRFSWRRLSSGSRKLILGSPQLQLHGPNVERRGAAVPASKPVIVNFGCGPYAPAGHVINVDGSYTALLARLPVPAAVFGPKARHVRGMRGGAVRYGTARRMRWPRSSIDGFYASHVLEHMARSDCIALLARVREWLRPRGVLRIVLPDLKKYVHWYADGSIDNAELIRLLGLAVDDGRWWRVAFGRDLHRWMYDAKTMVGILEDLGYAKIRACECGESVLDELASLDLAVNRAAESFYLEALRW